MSCYRHKLLTVHWREAAGGYGKGAGSDLDLVLVVVVGWLVGVKENVLQNRF